MSVLLHTSVLNGTDSFERHPERTRNINKLLFYIYCHRNFSRGKSSLSNRYKTDTTLTATHHCGSDSSWQPSTFSRQIQLTSLLPSDPLQSIRPIYGVVYQAAAFVRTKDSFRMVFSLLRSVYLSRPTHSPCFTTKTDRQDNQLPTRRNKTLFAQYPVASSLLSQLKAPQHPQQWTQ